MIDAEYLELAAVEIEDLIAERDAISKKILEWLRDFAASGIERAELDDEIVRLRAARRAAELAPKAGQGEMFA